MGNIIGLPSNVFLAPMAGITDMPMRKIVHSKGKGNLYSEMVAINAIQFKNPKSYRIADVREEPYPVVVQLVGNDEDLFAEAAELISDLGAYSIDINMGCPVKKIVSNRSGSYLMKDMDKAAKIIEKTVEATKLKVSVKFRKGWDTNSVNAVSFAKMCENCGASYITVHGRTKSQMYSGKADWDIIREVKENVKIPVIGNGDIISPQKAREMMLYTKADGVMIARGALGNPWIIGQTHELLNGGKPAPAPNITEIKETLQSHIAELMRYYGEKMGVAISRKHVCWYSKSLHDAKKFREIYMKIDNIDDATKAINDFFQTTRE